MGQSQPRYRVTATPRRKVTRHHFLMLSHVEWLSLNFVALHPRANGKAVVEYLKGCGETFHPSSVYFALVRLHDKRVLLQDHRKRYTVTPIGDVLLKTFIWHKSHRRFELRATS